jgi:hypothetical protein
MKEIIVGKIHGHFSQVSPSYLLGDSVGYCQRALVVEAQMIRTQKGKQNRSLMVAMYGTSCTIPPRKQKQ